MELSEFITSTLVDIAEGISNATNELESNTAIVNPTDINFNSSKPGSSILGTYKRDSGFEDSGPIVSQIDFDVAVTANEASGKAGKAGIKVMSVGIGGEADSKKEYSHTSRIKFSIPMVLPAGE